MGQYYLTVNIDKREFLDPHKFGDGLKLMEFGNSAEGVLTGLAVLLANGNGRGGGDLHVPDTHPEKWVPGHWAGDRIVVAGDYGDPGFGIDLAWAKQYIPTLPIKHLKDYGYYLRDEDFVPTDELDPEFWDKLDLYALARMTFKDISDPVIQCIAAGEGASHRLARLDTDGNGWRHDRALQQEMAAARALDTLQQAIRKEDRLGILNALAVYKVALADLDAIERDIQTDATKKANAGA